MTAEKIAIISGKGGVGKTVLTANLGSIMSHLLDKEVIIIDTDVSGSHLGLHLGFYSNPATISSVLKGEHSPEESLYEHETGLKVVPGALKYDDIKDVDVYHLDKVLEEFEDNADIILLDCGPGVDRETSAAIRSADKVLYISKPSFASVIDVVRTDSLVDELGKDSIGIVLNMVKGEKHELGPSEIESFTDMEVFGKIPYDSVVEESLSQGTPVSVYDPHSKASRAFEDLAAKLLDEEPVQERRTVFRRLREIIPGL